MDATIRATLDKITSLKSLADGFAAATALMKQTNDDQAAKIADLQAKVDAGTDVTADDLAALAAGNTTLDEIIAEVPTAVTANTTG